MIQDWGFNYIYLWQQEAITRINLLDDSYGDVACTPMEEYEFATLTDISSKHSWGNSTSHLWMCGASDGEKEEKKDPYIPEPFPNDKSILDAWMGTLATVDVCVNEVTPTIFCDKEEFEIVPFQMVSIILDPQDQINSEEDERNTYVKETEAMHVKDEISICNESQIEEVVESSFDREDPDRELFYDACDELEEYQEQDPIVIQLKDGR